MAWELADQDAPAMAVNKVNRITWNEATHQMMALPVWVDVLFNAATNEFAIIGRRTDGHYQVHRTDSNTYYIECLDALTQMGMANLAAIYRVTPIPLPADDVQIRMNGVYAPVKPA